MNVLISSLLQLTLWNYCGACNCVPKCICLFIYVVSYSLVVPRLHCWVTAFSSCGTQGLPSRRGAQVSHCGAFSGGTRALEPMGYKSCSTEPLPLLGSVGVSPRLLTTGPTAVMHWRNCSEAWGTVQGPNPHLLHQQANSLPLIPQGNAPKFSYSVSTLDYIVENSYYTFGKARYWDLKDSPPDSLTVFYRHTWCLRSYAPTWRQ